MVATERAKLVGLKSASNEIDKTLILMLAAGAMFIVSVSTVGFIFGGLAIGVLALVASTALLMFIACAARLILIQR